MDSTPWIFNLFQINSTIEQEHEREHHLAEIIVSLRGNDQMFSEHFGLWRKIPLFFDPTRLRQNRFNFFFFFLQNNLSSLNGLGLRDDSIKIEVVSLPSKKHLLVLATRIVVTLRCLFQAGAIKILRNFEISKESLKSFELLYVAYLKQPRYF